MRALARVLTIGSFAGLGGIAYTVFSPVPPSQPTEVISEATPIESNPEEGKPPHRPAPVAAVGIRITPDDIANNSQSTVDTQQLLDVVPEAETLPPTRRQTLAEVIQPTSNSGQSVPVARDSSGVSTADLIKLTEAVNRSAALTQRTNQPQPGTYAFAPGVGLPVAGNSPRRSNANPSQAVPSGSQNGTSGGGGGGSPAFGGANSNSPGVAEQGGVLQAITSQAPGTTNSTSGSNLLAANSGSGSDSSKDYSKFGIQNAQFWAFDFTAGDNADGDVNGDSIVDVQDARFQFDAYLDYLQQELDSPEHLQVVRNSVDDLSRIFDEFNEEAAQKQDPDPTDAISENFVSYMIIEFDTKGFYLPNNQKFQDQASNSNAWQFNANPNPGLNP